MSWRGRAGQLLRREDKTVGTKLVLLIVEKFFLAAFAAAAFVAYDRYTTREREEIEERRNERSLEFERARLARDLLPALFDKATSAEARAYALRSALATRALTPDSVLNVALALRDQGLSDAQFTELTAPVIPDALEALLSEAERLARERRALFVDFMPGPFRDIPGVGDHVSRIDHQQLQLSTAFFTAVERGGLRLSTDLDSRALAAAHLEGMFFLCEASNQHLAEDRSRSPLFGIRLAACIDRLRYSGADSTAAALVGGTLADEMVSIGDFALARQIIAILRDSANRLYGAIARNLASIVVDSRARRQRPGAREAREAFWLWRVQWEAGELLMLMSRSNAQGKSSAGPGPETGVRPAVPILVPFVIEVRQTILDWPRDDLSMERLSQMLEGGKIVRLVVEILGNDGSAEGLAALRSLRTLPRDAFRPFPFLEEDLDRVLSAKR